MSVAFLRNIFLVVIFDYKTYFYCHKKSSLLTDLNCADLVGENGK